MDKKYYFMNSYIEISGKETLADYKKAIQVFCNANPNLTIYVAGEISHPGMSDLDFVVLDEKPKVPNEVKKFLMGGNIIVFPSSQIENIRMIEKFDLRQVSGKKSYNIKDYRGDFAKITEIIEWLPERILKLSSEKESNSSPRYKSLIIKSAWRSFSNVENLLKIEPLKYTDVNFVRKNIDSIDMKKVIKEYIDVGTVYWEKFSSYCKDRNIIDYSNVSGRFAMNDYYSFDTVDYGVLSVYLNLISNFKYNISKSLLKKCDFKVIEPKVDLNFYNYAHERFGILNEVFDFHVSKNIDGMIKYGWLLNK
jgi:hypothetical protein